MMRMWLWWRTRKWKPEDHDDCMSFMGPCNLCTERMEYVRLCESLGLTRWQRFMLWFTPHREGRHEPDSFFGHWIPGCDEDSCHRECGHLQRRLSYAFPRAVLVSKAWDVETAQRTPRCDPECTFFGPCDDCARIANALGPPEGWD